MPDDKKSGYNYAVCVLDRYGNEYEPVYYGQSGVECIGGNSGLTADYADGELRLSAVADEVFVYNEAGPCCKFSQLQPFGVVGSGWHVYCQNDWQRRGVD